MSDTAHPSTRVLLAGPMGACLSNYDFAIYGTMSALVFRACLVWILTRRPG
ncbi:hypothetical protein HQ32_02931, partial [Prauserella sp. Am3]